MKIGIDIDGVILDFERTMQTYAELYDLLILKKSGKINNNFSYLDKRVIEILDETNKTKINVNQGYSNCSCRPINDNALITSDKGIFDECIKNGIDVLYLETDSIKLLDSNNQFSNMKGFIGGATFIIDNTLILFGSIDFLGNENKLKLLSFLDKYNIKIKDFSDFEIIDYGGVQFT